MEFPSNLEWIGERAFAECPIESIVIPKGTKSIEKKAFLNCKELKSVQIPDSTKLGLEAFDGCDGLADRDSAIVVNQTLFGVADAGSTTRYLMPLKLGPEIAAISARACLLPEIVYRLVEKKSIPPELSALQVGSRICFGRFPVQTDFEPQDLEWVIIAMQQEKALLITTHAIMTSPVSGGGGCRLGNLRSSNIAQWRFHGYHVYARRTRSHWPTNNTPSKASAITDHVFLLSWRETQNYLKDTMPLVALPTPYARAQICACPTKETHT